MYNGGCLWPNSWSVFKTYNCFDIFAYHNFNPTTKMNFIRNFNQMNNQRASFDDILMPWRMILYVYWQKSLIPWTIIYYDQQLYQKRRSRWKERHRILIFLILGQLSLLSIEQILWTIFSMWYVMLWYSMRSVAIVCC